jgi:6-phosphogluconolactonase (cycloisomerase 2 family)
VALRGSVLLVTDLGSDVIWAVDAATGGVEEWIRMPPGSGPRHMAWSGDQLLVVGELDSTLYRIDASTWSTPSLASSASTRGQVRSGLSEPSHLLVVDDSAYVLNRGPDELVRLSASGDLGRLESVSTGGAWPRHFALVDTHFLVANQRGGGITRVPRDRDGHLGAAEPALPGMVEPAVVVRC